MFPGEGRMRDLFHHLHGMKARTAATGRHLAATIRGPVLWLTLCGGLLVAAIFVGTIMMAGEFRERALRQQRARAGEHRPPAGPSLRPAVRGLRHARRRRDLPAANFRHRLGEGIPETCRKLRSARDPEVQGGRPVLSRRHLHLRFQRRHDQLVAAAAGATSSTFPSGPISRASSSMRDRRPFRPSRFAAISAAI